MQTIKTSVQAFLRRLGLYHRLKVSFLYYVYWKVVNSSVIDDADAELKFYRTLLGGFRRGDLIFDIGANHGSKTDFFLRLGARVVAAEPDEANKEILEEKFLRYRLIPKQVIIVNRAVSDRYGVETMWIDAPGSAKNTFSKKWVDTLRTDDKRFGHVLGFSQRKEVITTTIDQLVSEHGAPFYIKIDVEGHEVSVLRGMRRAVPYLSFEVNLPEFRPEGLECVELLRRLDADGRFNYAADFARGLVLEQWLAPEEFARVLGQCAEESIEVFWKTSRTPDA